MSSCDIAFVGHMCLERIVPFEGPAQAAPGSAVLCGAMAAARIGKKVAVVAKMAPADEEILDPMRRAGIETFVIPAEQTTFMEVIHPTADVDVRLMFQRKNAGFFRVEDVPALDSRHWHLAGITDREFTMDFLLAMRRRTRSLSVDMQSFVRQVDEETHMVAFADAKDKRRIAALMDKLKLDVVEAKILTGMDDIERAAVEVESWGCGEVVITRSEGALARAGGRTWYEKFSNANSSGRTGRGDTAFAAYLARRMDHDVGESLKFAAALVSIKMETPCPFRGTLDAVLARMRERHGG